MKQGDAGEPDMDEAVTRVLVRDLRFLLVESAILQWQPLPVQILPDLVTG